MRWSLRMVLSLAVVHWAISADPVFAQQTTRPATGAPAAAKPAAPAAAKPAAPPIDPNGVRMQLLLAQWAKQSTQLRSLDVKIRRLDKSAKWDDETYEGRAMFKSPNQAWLDFQKVVEKEGKKQLVPHERIICTGKQVWQYRSDTHQIYVHELGVQQRQRALQEGPLPFLFNFQADEARKRYQMKLLTEDPKSYVISVLPLLPIDKEAFSAAWVELDKTMLLPTQIVLLDPEGKSKKFFQMSGIKPNAPVMAENFQGQKLGPPWKVLYNKDEAQPAAGPVAPEAPRTGAAGQTVPPRRGVLGGKIR